jgi:hypothetical protein
MNMTTAKDRETITGIFTQRQKVPHLSVYCVNVMPREASLREHVECKVPQTGEESGTFLARCLHEVARGKLHGSC